ncbi:MAG: hypothetical protein ACOC8O_04365 [Natronomonas sp.]
MTVQSEFNPDRRTGPGVGSLVEAIRRDAGSPACHSPRVAVLKGPVRAFANSVVEKNGNGDWYLSGRSSTYTASRMAFGLEDVPPR